MRVIPAPGPKDFTVLELVQRCRYCQREMQCSALSYAENPFCSVCLPERIAQVAGNEPVHWEIVGDILVRIPARSGT